MISSSRDSDIPVPHSLSHLSKRALYPVIHEVESSAAGGVPRVSELHGSERRLVWEKRFFGQEAFSSVEHLLPHNAHACSFERLL